MITKNKKAAMEMSMGTIVTIVLVVVTLVLALVLIRSIFSSGTNAVSSINSAIEDQINQLFASSETTDVVIAPASQTIDIKRGDSPKGFAFSVKNWETSGQVSFHYSIAPSPDASTQCPGGDAASYIFAGSGDFTLGPSTKLDAPLLVRFSIPKSAPVCTITYVLKVEETGGPGMSTTDTTRQRQIFINIK